jgi:methylenetetrahydrofolate dehydrogenase (NADP+)/methenyltetrahydrofolate cyclohydrolase
MSQAVEIRGGPLAKEIRAAVAAQVAAWHARGVRPKLAVVLATDDPAALSYVRSKEKAAAALGIDTELIALGSGTSQAVLEARIAAAGADPTVHGILIELPLPRGLDAERAMDRVPAVKDVDGMTAESLGLLHVGREGEALVSATAQACVALAETRGPLEGRRVGLVGRGRTVGRPLLAMLVNRRATVTVCHTATRDLTAALRDCEVVFVAVGKPGAIRGEHLAAGTVVIDAGINQVGDTLVGDVDADAARATAAFTPVPGGVGTLTTAIVFRNLVKTVGLQHPEVTT